jgi:hypothetical protein
MGRIMVNMGRMMTSEEASSSYASSDFPMLRPKFLCDIGRFRVHRNFPCRLSKYVMKPEIAVVFLVFLSCRGKKVLFAGYPCIRSHCHITANLLAR